MLLTDQQFNALSFTGIDIAQMMEYQGARLVEIEPVWAGYHIDGKPVPCGLTLYFERSNGQIDAVDLETAAECSTDELLISRANIRPAAGGFLP